MYIWLKKKSILESFLRGLRRTKHCDILIIKYATIFLQYIDSSIVFRKSTPVFSVLIPQSLDSNVSSRLSGWKLACERSIYLRKSPSPFLSVYLFVAYVLPLYTLFLHLLSLFQSVTGHAKCSPTSHTLFPSSHLSTFSSLPPSFLS